MSILRRRRILFVFISAFVGIAFQFIPGLWAPGFFGAAILFRQGIHSDYPGLYMALAFAINLALFGGASYWLLTRISSVRAGVGHERRTSEPTPDPTSDRLSKRPVKGIIYTESEIEEFKRRGLM
jgi:hypothetical protein